MAETVRSTVQHMLVSGTHEQLVDFHLLVCSFLMAHERRGQTVNYTCMPEDYEEALKAAREEKCTVQLVEHVGGHETYRTVLTGETPEWRPRVRGVAEGGSQYFVNVTCATCGRFWVEETKNAALVHKTVTCSVCQSKGQG